MPAIVSNVTIPLLGLCDTAIAGHLGAVAALGAISVGAMMINVVTWLAGFLRMGCTGMTAQMYGAGSASGVRKVLRLTVWMSLAIGLGVVTLQMPLERVLLDLLTPEGDVRELASRYFLICVWGVPAQLIVMAFTGWFIGLSDTRVPMIVSIGVSAVNVVASFVYALVLDYGVSGVAAGTVTANWLGAVSIVIAGMRRQSRLTGEGNEAGVKLSVFFKVNGNLFLRSVFLLSVSLAMTAFGSRMGDVVLGANAVMMQFFFFFSYFMDGFAFAGEAMTGRCHGAGDREGLRDSIRALLTWGAVMAVLFLLIYLVAWRPISGLLTDQPAVIEEISAMRVWVIMLPPVTVLAFVYDGICIGLTRTSRMLLATMVGAAAFFGISLLTSRSNMHLWLAFEIYLFLRGLILCFDRKLYGSVPKAN